VDCSLTNLIWGKSPKLATPIIVTTVGLTMKKFVAKLRKNDGTKKFVVILTNGQKVTVRAKDVHTSYKLGTGVCCEIRWEGRKTAATFIPASVAAIVVK